MVAIPLAFTTVTGIGQVVANDLVNTFGGSPDRIVLATVGGIAWDGCDCGQFIQTINFVAPSRNFPAPATDTPETGCGHPLVVVNVTASLVRCVPGVDDNGNPPTPDDLMTAALVLESDRLALRQSLFCALNNLHKQYKIFGFTTGVAQSVGPEGQCGGVEVTYTFGLNNDAMCC